MRYITIRECAIRALAEMRDDERAGKLLLAICREAFGGEAPDFDREGGELCDYGSHVLPAVYGAIAPDIKASANWEPSPQDINELVEQLQSRLVGDSDDD